MVVRIWVLALTVLAVSFALPHVTPAKQAAYVPEKREAVRLAKEARALVGERLLGVDYSETTTTLGYEDAKRLSAAPDFPALLVQWLKEAGVGKQSTVAINASGSFPALTIAALAATEAVGAQPLLISSLGASSFGANRPDFTWLHMEKRLTAQKPHWKSIAVSLGGDGDMARSLPTEGQQALANALALTDAPQLVPVTAHDVIALRLESWRQHNNGTLPDLLINAGGNLAFWGTQDRDSMRQEGLLLPKTALLPHRDGVGDVFLQQGKPVIHLLGIKKIAAAYQITMPPTKNSVLWEQPHMALWARLAMAGGVLGCPLLLVMLGRGPNNQHVVP